MQAKLIRVYVGRCESVELEVMEERDYENCREKTLRNSVASLY